MNIRDFEPIPGITFTDVFKKQKVLMTKYEPYLVESIKEFDINTLEDQDLFKSFMLVRVVEELTEATVDINNREHFEEEIIDSFNFLVESYILYGWNYSDLAPWHGKKNKNAQNPKFVSDAKLAIFDVIEQIGLTCNYLKNRKWRASQYLVDLLFFERDFQSVWDKFNTMCNLVGISEQRILDLWSLKMQVNEFRLTTRY